MTRVPGDGLHGLGFWEQNGETLSDKREEKRSPEVETCGASHCHCVFGRHEENRYWELVGRVEPRERAWREEAEYE